MKLQHIPLVLVREAIKPHAVIGLQYDSSGRHVCYWYQVPGSDWRVYRHSVSDMLALLRQH